MLIYPNKGIKKWNKTFLWTFFVFKFVNKLSCFTPGITRVAFSPTQKEKDMGLVIDGITYYQGVGLLNLVVSLVVAKFRVGNVQIKEEDVNSQTDLVSLSISLFKS